MDLDEETFIQADEMVSYANEAIREAESEILTLYEDYFLTRASLSLTTGVSVYSLPSGIFASKIRAVVYRNGSVVYEVLPYRKLKKFLNIEMSRAFGTSEDYQYYIDNPSAILGYQFNLLPASRETSSNITIHYLREANTIPLVSAGSQAASDATTIDIPEFYTFIVQYMKMRIYEKEGDPRHDDALQKLQYERQMMNSTLAKMVPDDNDLVDMDLTIFREHS